VAFATGEDPTFVTLAQTKFVSPSRAWPGAPFGSSPGTTQISGLRYQGSPSRITSSIAISTTSCSVVDAHFAASEVSIYPANFFPQQIPACDSPKYTRDQHRCPTVHHATSFYVFGDKPYNVPGRRSLAVLIITHSTSSFHTARFSSIRFLSLNMSSLRTLPYHTAAYGQNISRPNGDAFCGGRHSENAEQK
jgi:hypothetical protein